MRNAVCVCYWPREKAGIFALQAGEAKDLYIPWLCSQPFRRISGMVSVQLLVRGQVLAVLWQARFSHPSFIVPLETKCWKEGQCWEKEQKDPLTLCHSKSVFVVLAWTLGLIRESEVCITILSSLRKGMILPITDLSWSQLQSLLCSGLTSYQTVWSLFLGDKLLLQMHQASAFSFLPGGIPVPSSLSQ